MKKISKETVKKIAEFAGKGVLTDDNGEIILKGYRFVMISSKYFPYGIGEVNTLRPVLYRVGEKMGREFFKRWKDLAGDRSRAMEMIFGMLVYQGLGTFEIVDQQKDKVVVRFYNSFEVASYLKNSEGKESETPVCHLTRGLLGGIYSEYLGKRVNVEGTTCAATGKSNYCEFVINIPQE